MGGIAFLFQTLESSTHTQGVEKKNLFIHNFSNENSVQS